MKNAVLLFWLALPLLYSKQVKSPESDPFRRILSGPEHPIYSKNKSFTFVVEKRNGFVTEYDTLQFITTNQPWPADPTQLKACWLSSKTDSSTCRFGTGFIESDSLIWLHPVRDDDYGVLEYSPFPQIKLPASIGRSWTEEFATGGRKWSNNKWINYTGLFTIKNRYKITGEQTFSFNGNSISVLVVTAEGKSDVSGNARLKALFSIDYGFVSLNYENIDASMYSFRLISVTDN